MRIAIVSEVFLPKIDGVVNRTLNLVRHLPRFGDDAERLESPRVDVESSRSGHHHHDF